MDVPTYEVSAASFSATTGRACKAPAMVSAAKEAASVRRRIGCFICAPLDMEDIFIITHSREMCKSYGGFSSFPRIVLCILTNPLMLSAASKRETRQCCLRIGGFPFSGTLCYRSKTARRRQSDCNRRRMPRIGRDQRLALLASKQALQYTGLSSLGWKVSLAVAPHSEQIAS